MTGYFLGGSLAPVGLAVAFLRQRLAVVRASMLAWRRELHQSIEETGPVPFPACVDLIDVVESPWTTELLIDAGEWTAYVNNQIGGGDTTAAAPYLSKRLGCDCVIAENAPPHGPGHAATQLWLLGPDGVPPLMYRRVLSAHATDGRWRWEASGTPQPWEHVERYEARRIRDRLDRPLLVEYLAAMGIRVDDADFYGNGHRVRQIVDWQRRQLTIAQARAQYE